MGERDEPGTIGRRVQQLRVGRGLTQKQLAEPVYTPAYISTLEAGCAPPTRRCGISPSGSESSSTNWRPGVRRAG